MDQKLVAIGPAQIYKNTAIFLRAISGKMRKKIQYLMVREKSGRGRGNALGIQADIMLYTCFLKY
jgi:hypothetical protein